MGASVCQKFEKESFQRKVRGKSGKVFPHWILCFEYFWANFCLRRESARSHAIAARTATRGGLYL